MLCYVHGWHQLGARGRYFTNSTLSHLHEKDHTVYRELDGRAPRGHVCIAGEQWQVTKPAEEQQSTAGTQPNVNAIGSQANGNATNHDVKQHTATTWRRPQSVPVI